MILDTVKLTSKWQATYTKAVREFLALEPGDEIDYVLENGKVTIQKHQKKTFDREAFIQETIAYKTAYGDVSTQALLDEDWSNEEWEIME
jgi:bifunctional DNA-binding transcriptional regulator/antitoxin component of YhaV-PrlF toxin-antitoxin module